MKIVFSLPAWQKINAYIATAEGEIEGIGQARLDETKTILTVVDVWIWDQVCSAGHTEITNHDTVFDLVENLTKHGVPIEELCLWWHSHANMGAFFSAEDQTNIDDWVNDKFLVSVVGNKKGEFKGRIDIKAPIPCTLDNLTVEYENSLPQALLTKIEKEVAQKVKKPTYNEPLGYQKKGKKNKKDVAKLLVEHEERCLDSAETCGCKECLDYLNGYRNSFPYHSHATDPATGLYARRYAERIIEGERHSLI